MSNIEGRRGFFRNSLGLGLGAVCGYFGLRPMAGTPSISVQTLPKSPNVGGITWDPSTESWFKSSSVVGGYYEGDFRSIDPQHHGCGNSAAMYMDIDGNRCYPSDYTKLIDVEPHRAEGVFTSRSWPQFEIEVPQGWVDEVNSHPTVYPGLSVVPSEYI